MPAISSRLATRGNLVLFAFSTGFTASVACQGSDDAGPATNGGAVSTVDSGTATTTGGASSTMATTGTPSTATGTSATVGTASTTGGAGGATTTGTTVGAGGAVATVDGSSGSGTMGQGGATTGAAGGAGGVGGSGGSTCDTSPGMAMQFAEGVVDQMTGNLGADGPSGDEARTLELWAKFTSINSWTAEQTIIELGRRGNAGDMVWGIDMSGYSGTGGRFGPYTNGVTDNNGSAGPFYEAAEDVGWLHLSWAYEGNGGEMVFTVNGEQLPIQDPGSNYTLDLTPGIVTLGASQNFGETGWDGVMDEVRIWTVYRSPTEIADTMNVFLTGNEEGLAAYYNFDDGDGSYVDDVLGDMNHRLEPCTSGNDDRCTAVNNAMPTLVASDLPGPFTCAE